MISPLIIETLKNPFSAPAILIVFLLTISFVILKLSLENINVQRKYNNPGLFILAIVVFLTSIALHFYKLADIPPAGHEDDTKVVISAYILKNSGHDSTGKTIPYFPELRIFYHKEYVGGDGQRPAVYIQAFIQHFVPPGYFSFRLGATTITCFSTIIIVFISFLLTKNWAASFLTGALFISLPWTRTCARATAEYAPYCFASTSFIFSLFYLVKNNKFLGIFFYLLSLIILYMSYAAGLLLAPLCAILVPLVFRLHSKEYINLSKKLLILSIVSLGILYFLSKEDGGFISNVLRAQHAQGLKGIENFNLKELSSTLTKNASIYLANYFSYLLPQYLFMVGDGNLRHHTGFGGQLFISLFIAFYVGLVYLVENYKKDIYCKLLLTYLLLAIFPASICLEGATEQLTKLPLHAIRSGGMLPALGIILLLGLTKIFRKSKILFSIYILIICFNAYLFHYDYLYNYSKKLGNSWIADPGLPKVTQKALKIIKKHPDKKLFYHCSTYSIACHNLDTIGIDALLKGDGILSNVYNYSDYKDKIPIQKGDLLVVQEPFDYINLNKKFKFILRVRNQYLPNNDFGASLLEITK